MAKHNCVLCDGEATAATRLGPMCGECVEPLDLATKEASV